MSNLLAGSAPHPAEKYKPSGHLRRRYGGISARTLARWIKAGVIPAPDLEIRGRKYWKEETLDEHDARMAAAAAQGRHCRRRSAS